MSTEVALTVMHPLRFDDSGFPMSDQDDKPLTKSATKRLKKQLKVHSKRHSKWLSKAKSEPVASAPPQPPTVAGATTHQSAKVVEPKASSVEAAETTVKTTDKTASSATAASHPIAHTMPRVVNGTFGNRQALKFESISGPFTHKFSF